MPAPDAASSLPADEAPPVPKMCAVATQTTEFPLPADPAGGLPSPALHVGTALGLPPALTRYIRASCVRKVQSETVILHTLNHRGVWFGKDLSYNLVQMLLP